MRLGLVNFGPGTLSNQSNIAEQLANEEERIIFQNDRAPYEGGEMAHWNSCYRWILDSRL
jgi:hypothetical protein